MKPKDLKGLETKEMMKCEACGSFHPVEDCEVITIKVIKGKNCELPAFGKLPEKLPVKVEYVHLDGPDRGEKIEPRIEDAPVMTETPVQQRPRKNIIPPGIAAMMISPGDPGFDQFGAKETRRV